LNTGQHGGHAVGFVVFCNIDFDARLPHRCVAEDTREKIIGRRAKTGVQIM